MENANKGRAEERARLNDVEQKCRSKLIECANTKASFIKEFSKCPNVFKVNKLIIQPLLDAIPDEDTYYTLAQEVANAEKLIKIDLVEFSMN